MRRFYGDLLGLREKAVPHTLDALRLVWFVAGDGEMEIHCVPDTHLPHPQEARHICLEVDNLERYRQQLEEAGYQIQETIPIPNRPRFFTTDPCGNRLELTSILDDYNAPSTQ
jgi:catechol 2,3-dioxygenase-like lactoylglutathione lyase family enzyme